MIYVVAHDGGCEGYSGPVQAFKTQGEADAAVAIGDGLVVFAVPEWPEVAVPWYMVKPVDEVLK